MKNKIGKRVFILLIMCFTLMLSISLKVTAAATWETTSFSQRDLGYGVTLDRYEGESTSSFNSTTKIDGRKQVIHTANIAKNSTARVVQWTKMPIYDNSWGNYTLEQIAEDYEAKHPGEKVLVATNNWLSETTSANVGELDGAQVSGGLNYRVTDKQGTEGAWVFHSFYGYIPRPAFLGFDATGKKAYFTNDWNNGQNYTDKLMLSFFNGYSEERTKLNIAVDKINEAPNAGEIAIYFKNYDGGVQTFSDAKIYKFDGTNLRYDNRSGSNFVERDAFAMGTLNAVVDKLDTGYGTNTINTFHIVSRNDDFNKIDLADKTLVAQYELLGEFANVVGGTTYYGHIVRDGETYPGSFGHWNEINCEVHPRTAFIIKEDGTFALSVIDGRQKDKTGMDYEDMANFYKVNYNGYNVFSYDGGGSSAMVVTKQGGGFEVVNSPADGHQRRVGNATLIVVDKEKYDITQNTRDDDAITLEVSNIDSSVTKITAILGDVKKEVVDGKVTFDSLDNDTNYSVKFMYEVDGEEYIGSTFIAPTCPIFATMNFFKQKEATQNSVTLEIRVDNPSNNFKQGTVEIDGKIEYFKDQEVLVMIDGLKYSTEYECKITIFSKTGTINDYPTEYIKTVKTDEARYAEEIFVTADKTTLSVGDEIKLEVTTEPADITKSFKYESSDSNVIKVSSSGKVTAITSGTAVVTVSTREGVSKEITFTVEEVLEETKGGCKKDLSSSIIGTISFATLAFFVLRKKK